MLMTQVDPKETDEWTKVEFVSAESPISASLVVIYIYSDSAFNARVSAVTAVACIPHLRKYCFRFMRVAFSCILRLQFHNIKHKQTFIHHKKSITAEKWTKCIALRGLV